MEVRSQSYRDLIVWQKGIELCCIVYEVCSAFPKSELYGLADQMKRAAVSIPSNIAEGQARQYASEFRHFLSVASGSLAELDTQRIIAMNVDFLSQEDSMSLEQKIAEVRKMLYALTRSIKAEN